MRGVGLETRRGCGWRKIHRYVKNARFIGADGLCSRWVQSYWNEKAIQNAEAAAKNSDVNLTIRSFHAGAETHIYANKFNKNNVKFRPVLVGIADVFNMHSYDEKIDVSTGKEPTLASNKNSIILEAFKTDVDDMPKKNENEDEMLNEFGIDIDSVNEAENLDYIINHGSNSDDRNEEDKEDESENKNDNDTNEKNYNSEHTLDNFMNMNF